MSQSDHTSNFHDYVIISVHIRLFFVSVAQLFAKLILSVGQFLYHKVFEAPLLRRGASFMLKCLYLSGYVRLFKYEAALSN